MAKPKKKTHSSFQKAILADRKRRGLGVGEQATLPGTRVVGRAGRSARKIHELHVDAFKRLGKGIFGAVRGVRIDSPR